MEYSQIRNLKKLVEKGLSECEDCRNSDIKLTNWIWVNYFSEFITKDENGQYAVRLMDIYELPSQDSVKRIRAKFQNEKHLYLPNSEEVRKQRKISEEQWRIYLGYNPELRTL